MMFRFHSSQFSKATRGIAASIFIVGMLFIGFGVLILALPPLFIALAAGVFFLIGLSVIGYSIKLFFILKKMQQKPHDPNDAYRNNVTIHRDSRFEN